MKKQEPTKQGLDKIKPEWRLPMWYLGLLFLQLGLWQDAFVQFTVHTIPSSDFKAHFARGAVQECAIRERTLPGASRRTRTGDDGALANRDLRCADVLPADRAAHAS